MSRIPVRLTRRLVLQAPRRDLPYSSSGAAAAADGFGQRNVHFQWQGDNGSAASGVTATVGDDDIISMGGSNAEKAIRYLYHTRSYLVKAGKSPGSCQVAMKSPGSPVSIVTGLVVLQW